MPMLHTVNKSPYERKALERCLEFAEDGAAVLLIEDGVYAADGAGAAAGPLGQAMGRLKVYVLGPDLTARGLAEDRLLEGVAVVDYGGFVDLAAEHSAVHSWL